MMNEHGSTLSEFDAAWLYDSLIHFELHGTWPDEIPEEYVAEPRIRVLAKLWRRVAEYYHGRCTDLEGELLQAQEELDGLQQETAELAPSDEMLDKTVAVLDDLPPHLAPPGGTEPDEKARHVVHQLEQALKLLRLKTPSAEFDAEIASLILEKKK